MKFDISWLKRKPITSAKILVNGKLIVFLACSLVSSFINLIFITNLTKSDYGIGTVLSIPAAVLLGFLSISLDFSKCLHAIQVNTLNELCRKLSKYPWCGKVKRVARKWFIVYLLYVILSIITSVSLSSISIGAGITRNANMLEQIDEQIAQGQLYENIKKGTTNVQFESYINKATDKTEQEAIRFVNEQVMNIWPKIQEWQDEYTDFLNAGLNPDDYTAVEGGYKGSNSYGDYWVKRNREINNYLSSSKYSNAILKERAIKSLTLTDFETKIKENYLKTYSTVESDTALEKMSELTDTSLNEAAGWLKTLNALQFVNPKNNEIIVFEEEGDIIVNVQQAITRLKALRLDIENDNGDIGSSSKIFMQVGSSFSKQKKTELNNILDDNKAKGSFGATEVMMMLMLLFLSLLCELAINQFSPKTNISRKMLNQFSQYFPVDFDVNDFMLDIYIEQYNYGLMSKEKFDESVNNTLSVMDITKKKLKDNYTKNRKNGEELKCKELKEYYTSVLKSKEDEISSLKDNVNNSEQENINLKERVESLKKAYEQLFDATKAEIDSLRDENRKILKKNEENSAEETHSAENLPENKMVVKSAEKEIQEMIAEKRS